MEEQEIKLRMADPEGAREAVAQMGAVLEGPRHFEDNLLFDDDAGRLQKAGAVLRLRRTSIGPAVLTFKGQKRLVEGVRSREETESEVADADAVEAVLAGLGYAPRFRYQKFRETYSWRDVEIVVDETPVGVFLEIEGPIPTIRAAAEKLGRGPSEFVTESYVALFLAAGGVGDMVFPRP
jgi:adenylate cyclase, class 2